MYLSFIVLTATYIWLISICVYHPPWQVNMRLLDDVCLIVSVILSRPLLAHGLDQASKGNVSDGTSMEDNTVLL